MTIYPLVYHVLLYTVTLKAGRGAFMSRQSTSSCAGRLDQAPPLMA